MKLYFFGHLNTLTISQGLRRQIFSALQILPIQTIASYSQPANRIDQPLKDPRMSRAHAGDDVRLRRRATNPRRFNPTFPTPKLENNETPTRRLPKMKRTFSEWNYSSQSWEEFGWIINVKSIEWVGWRYLHLRMWNARETARENRTKSFWRKCN